MIKATVKTEGFRGLTERAITLETNDPEIPRMAVFIRVDAEVGVALLPAASLSLGRGRAARPESSLLVRRAPSIEQVLQVEGVEASAPWLRATARPVTASEPAGVGRPAAEPGDWVVDVALVPGAPSGTSVQKVAFRTGLTVEPRVEIPVRVTVPFPVNLSVPNLVLHPGPEGLEGTVLLTVRPDLDPAGMEVRADPPYAALVESGGDRAFRVTVKAPTGSQVPGKIVFRIQGEEAVLPVAPPPAPVR